MNPFKNMKHIPTHEELVDKAFRKASKVSRDPHVKDKVMREKLLEMQKISTVSNVIRDNIKEISRSVPNLDEVPEFYRKLIEISMPVDDVKKALATLNWISKKVRELELDYANKIKGENSIKRVKNVRRAFYGRVSSLIKKRRDAFHTLIQFKKLTAEFPSLKDMPTIIIAGYPNVGKSTLLRKVTGAQPQIADYPFTTKKLMVGYLDNELQLIDTPGILDRDPSKMKGIERKAITAISTLPSLMLYVFDVSETCGYDIEKQIGLLKRLMSLFPNLRIVCCINKMDLCQDEEKLRKLRDELEKLGLRWLETSSEDEKSIEELIKFLRVEMKNRASPRRRRHGHIPVREIKP